MKIKLLDYKGKSTFVEIPDNTEKISIIIASGDMIMTYPVICDSCSELRTLSFLDEVYIITKENFDKLNNLTSSYEVEDISEYI